MAANAGRGGGGAGGGNNNNNNGPISNTEHVEFSVKAEEDLYLTGTENTIRRVTAETNYSCLMLKTQRFSSLFRHYAKYHGLRKTDLEYYFVNLLQDEDTPESVQLQRSDTIMVRKKRKPEPPEVAADDDEFFADMKELLHDEEHMDAVFLIHSDNVDSSSNSDVLRKNINSVTTIIDEYKSETEDPKTFLMDTTPSSVIVENPTKMIQIRAHKSVLTARAEYFKGLFRTNTSINTGGNTKFISSPMDQDGAEVISTGPSPTMNTFKEAILCTINVEPFFREFHIRTILEFIYTNRVADIRKIPTDDLLSILHLSDKWLLRDLKKLCEHELIRSHLTVSSVARLYGAAEDFCAKRLSRACIDFIMANLRQVTTTEGFLEELQNFPNLVFPVLKAAADLIPEGPMTKKQRTTTTPSVGATLHDQHNSNTNTSSLTHGNPSSLLAAAGGGAAAVAAAPFRSSPVPDSDT